MRVQASCMFCSGPKVAEIRGQVVAAYALTYSSEEVARVWCDQCGLSYAPESIGCVQARGVPS